MHCSHHCPDLHNVSKPYIFFRLIRYLYPTDNELRTLAGIPKDKVKGKKGGKSNDKSDVFRIPRNLDIQVRQSCGFSKHCPITNCVLSNETCPSSFLTA